MTCVCTQAGTMAMNAPRVSPSRDLFILSSAANAECAWLRQLLSPASGSSDSGSGKTNDVGHLRPGRGLFLFVCGDMTLRCLGLGLCCHVTPLMRSPACKQSPDVIRCGEEIYTVYRY